MQERIFTSAIVPIVAPGKSDSLTYQNTPCLDLALNSHLLYFRSPFLIKIWRRKDFYSAQRKVQKITTQPRAEPAQAHACSILRNKERVRESAQGSGNYKSANQVKVRGKLLMLNYYFSDYRELWSKDGGKWVWTNWKSVKVVTYVDHWVSYSPFFIIFVNWGYIFLTLWWF